LFCSAQLSGIGNTQSSHENEKQSRRDEDALCRIIAVVGTGTPTQELESKRENQVGSEDATPTHRKEKTEQATIKSIPESNTNVTRKTKRQ